MAKFPRRPFTPKATVPEDEAEQRRLAANFDPGTIPDSEQDIADDFDREDRNRERLETASLRKQISKDVIGRRESARASDRRGSFLPGDPRGAEIQPRTFQEQIAANQQSFFTTPQGALIRDAADGFDVEGMAAGEVVRTSTGFVRRGIGGQLIPVKPTAEGLDFELDKKKIPFFQDIEKARRSVIESIFNPSPDLDHEAAPESVRKKRAKLREDVFESLKPEVFGHLTTGQKTKLLTEQIAARDDLDAATPKKVLSTAETFAKTGALSSTQEQARISGATFTIDDAAGTKVTFGPPEPEPKTKGTVTLDDGTSLPVEVGDRFSQNDIEYAVSAIDPVTGVVKREKIQAPPLGEGQQGPLNKQPLTRAGQTERDLRDFKEIILQERAGMSDAEKLKFLKAQGVQVPNEAKQGDLQDLMDNLGPQGQFALLIRGRDDRLRFRGLALDKPLPESFDDPDTDPDSAVEQPEQALSPDPTPEVAAPTTPIEPDSPPIEVRELSAMDDRAFLNHLHFATLHGRLDDLKRIRDTFHTSEYANKFGQDPEVLRTIDQAILQTRLRTNPPALSRQILMNTNVKLPDTIDGGMALGIDGMLGSEPLNGTVTRDFLMGGNTFTGSLSENPHYSSRANVWVDERGFHFADISGNLMVAPSTREEHDMWRDAFADVGWTWEFYDPYSGQVLP